MVFAYIRDLARLIVYQSIPLYYLSKKVSNNGQYPTQPEDNLCVEGYPSSANSFLFVLLKNLNNQLNFAHHTHAVASLKCAFRLGVPVVFIIRKPEDAIASRIARFDDNLTFCLLHYISLYRFVKRNETRICVVRFEDIKSNLENVLAEISRFSHLDFTIADKQVLNMTDQTFQEIKQHYIRRDAEERSATPSEDRETKKNRIKMDVISHPLFNTAEELFMQFDCS